VKRTTADLSFTEKLSKDMKIYARRWFLANLLAKVKKRDPQDTQTDAKYGAPLDTGMRILRCFFRYNIQLN